MSLADSMIRRAAPAYNAVQCDVWTVLSGSAAGQTFFGDAQTESPVILDTDLGQDAREKTMLYVDRPAPVLNRAAIISGKGASWQVIGSIDDNPANDRIKFEIVKLDAKDT